MINEPITTIKNKIKAILADLYDFLYRKKLFKNHIKVMTVEETIDELLHSEKSLVRFGDGEITVLRGNDIKLQQTTEEIKAGLTRILAYPYDGLMVSLQDIFEGVASYQEQSRRFWKEHLLFCRRLYNRYCNRSRIYANTSFSRFYYVFQDKQPCKAWIDKIKMIWDNKDIVIVEGMKSHSGAGNDLFLAAASVERILCPPSNAMQSFDSILKACESYPKDRLFLLSVGITAKFLAEELFLKGYRVIDIGNLDMEYEWYLQGTDQKLPLAKHGLVTEEENRAAGYTEYLQQVRRVIK